MSESVARIANARARSNHSQRRTAGELGRITGSSLACLVACPVVGLAVGLTAEARGQVTILSVERSVRVQACFGAPPEFGVQCEMYYEFNTQVGDWSGGTSYDFARSSGSTFGHAAVGGSQSSTISPDDLHAHGVSDTLVNSGGDGVATGFAANIFTVRFRTTSRTLAHLTSTAVGNLSLPMSISLSSGGSSLFASSGLHDITLTLPPGVYEYAMYNTSGGSCDGSCLQDEHGPFDVDVHFSPAPCTADFNGDTAVDFFDYDAFVVCFEGGACPPGPPPRTADFDGDGSVDFFDYDAFVVAFEAGCD
ncbi:MAG: hypothetical protein AABZ53_03660 [Planctomycetota bacterium]